MKECPVTSSDLDLAKLLQSGMTLSCATATKLLRRMSYEKPSTVLKRFRGCSAPCPRTTLPCQWYAALSLLATVVRLPLVLLKRNACAALIENGLSYREAHEATRSLDKESLLQLPVNQTSPVVLTLLENGRI